MIIVHSFSAGARGKRQCTYRLGTSNRYESISNSVNTSEVGDGTVAGNLKDLVVSNANMVRNAVNESNPVSTGGAILVGGWNAATQWVDAAAKGANGETYTASNPIADIGGIVKNTAVAIGSLAVCNLEKAGTSALSAGTGVFQVGQSGVSWVGENIFSLDKSQPVSK